MIRIHAQRHRAEMVNLHPLWNRPFEQLVSNPVSIQSLATNVDPTIPHVIEAPSPQPTPAIRLRAGLRFPPLLKATVHQLTLLGRRTSLGPTTRLPAGILVSATSFTPGTMIAPAPISHASPSSTLPQRMAPGLMMQWSPIVQSWSIWAPVLIRTLYPIWHPGC